MNEAIWREQLARKFEAMDGVVFASDDKNREMLSKSVVLTIIRNAPLERNRGWASSFSDQAGIRRTGFTSLVPVIVGRALPNHGGALDL